LKLYKLINGFLALTKGFEPYSLHLTAYPI
jgi:hypothetical protein